MSLPDIEVSQIIKLYQCGAHPALIADYLERDRRIILKKLAAHNIRGPWPKMPRGPIDPHIRAQARTILAQRTFGAISAALQTLKQDHQPLDGLQVSRLLRALIEERDHAEVRHNGV